MSNNHRPLWEVVGLSKSYPGVLANDNISLQLFEGSIHGLLGENGCGKSTLIKMLSGVQKPDAGEIRCQGRVVEFRDPIDASNKGIATVFQEFSIVPTLAVAENVFLGKLPTNRFGFIDWRAAYRQTEEIFAEMGIEIKPDAITGDLSVGEQQLVEIAKALGANARMIILDEPTAALGMAEIESLHQLLRRMKKKGCAIVYVSHRLDEVERIVDEVTILRNGAVVRKSGETKIDVDDIVSAMIGGEVSEHYPKVDNTQPDIVLDVRKIGTKKGVFDVSFTLNKGEVLGLGGVLGSGRTEIVHALFGVDKLTTGEIRVHGEAVDISSQIDSIRAGLALVPENRKFDGLFFNFAASGNTTSASLKSLSSMGFLNLRKEAELTQTYIRELEVSSQADEKSVGLLSGGNQQKIVIARWLASDADILIFDEPTQGIDIGAKLAVYKLINTLTAQGKSIILISSDHDELLAMSDRIAVVSHGSISRIVNAAELTHSDLVQASVDHSLNTYQECI
jgi:ABC-type sugar transport system ATPase subunit|tara:strand:- start:14655 stop:16178 length:1524 start_codon:yes stop_codon:yes gene_type:complete